MSAQGRAPSGQQRPPLALGIAVILVGVLIMLVAAGVIPVDEDDFEAPRWVAGVAGAAFFFAGITVTLLARGVPQRDPIHSLLGCLVVTTMAAPFNWIAFGPGERRFSGGFGIGGLWLFGDSSGELQGRIAFGVGALMMDLMAVLAWRGLIRKLIAANR